MLKIDIFELPVQFAAVELAEVKVTENQTAFARMLECAEEYAERYAWTPPSEIPGVQAARRLFHAVGIDPTKRRPSSEALLHRALKRKGFESVNALVDVGNWCSLEFLLPTCIYDVAQIEGLVVLRRGRPGEQYEALNGRLMEFEGKPVLADDLGPFGSPLTDSQRTAVRMHTRTALLGIWAPQDYDRSLLLEQAEQFAERALQVCGGKLVSLAVLPPAATQASPLSP
ncbi:MAG: phenylalanine--tRNA ligase beta subunit-related protein [candidate division KSB1 bacterium]|nr:phenylalanine--tRNA ligase beta subunit-related protein [candidate division KSB1 bacterium]MDZ7345945.1 phenylalanine--tRNA ligase beta subunit-related protein [candidate division KSB1 bacterium]